ncbi:MAG: patatin-like phospholipase family protein, partial [Gammaproteobacteria bacterium]
MTNYPKISTLVAFIVICATTLVQGCSIPGRLSAVPREQSTDAAIPGMPGIRYFVGGDLSQFIEDAKQSFYTEQAYRAKTGQTGPLPPANFLAISGGGDDGAFGAGLLCGWSAAGTRPEFKLVTGISTGALIAPFAFLGPAYDDKLKAVYTNSSPKDILEERSLFAAVFNDALADNKPLWHLLQKHVTTEMLQTIAKEYQQKGRILLIATTDLDNRRAVIWNMTKIAASGNPNAPDLFRKLMMASAAIPGAFPPTMIDVEANGKHYQEMHVDGGTVAQVFVYPPHLNVKAESANIGLKRERHLYIIRNARLDPAWSDVERRSLTIAGKAIESLISTQGIGDLYRIYLTAERDGLDYNLAFIPKTFNTPHKEDFDTGYMRALFENGY